MRNNRQVIIGLRETKSAEGTRCTIAENFIGATKLKKFNCDTGITLETITLQY